jgi:FMN-dependent NADH-azoreductase
MSELLLINASPRPAVSLGYRLANEFAQSQRERSPALLITHRDLHRTPLPPLETAYADALTRRTADTAAVFDQSRQLIEELERSEQVVIATPMHNFTVPATFKLWIDHVVRIGRTFAVTAQGKRGLLADRPVYVIVSSGGVHRGDQASQPDFLTPYLGHLLASIGLLDVRFIYMQGLVAGPGRVNAEYQAARSQLGL